MAFGPALVFLRIGNVISVTHPLNRQIGGHWRFERIAYFPALCGRTRRRQAPS
jgi:hypothetical protein